MTGIPGELALNLSGGIVLVGPAGARYVARALALAEQITSGRDGIAMPADYVLLRAVFAAAVAEGRAAGFADETGKVRQEPDMATCPAVVRAIGAGEVASLLGCSPQWARSLLRRGEFTSGRRRSREWVVDEGEVAAWLNGHGRAATVPANGSGYASRSTTPHQQGWR